MPGAYAHLTLVGLLSSSSSLEKAELPEEAIVAALENAPFIQLGAVSPDYPYLSIGNADDNKWADLMHYKKTGQMIHAGVRLVRSRKGSERAKAFAWLLGYAAHVGADVTIHPVVQYKVGPYEENRKAHRVCELNQDAYIFQRLSVGPVGASEYLNSGIWKCCDRPDSGILDPAVATAWDGMFQLCYPEEYKNGKPRLDEWHRSFKRVVDVAEESRSLPAFARHLGVSAGLTYPADEEIDMQYIENLDTPLGKLHYDQVFDRAMQNVQRLWSLIAKGVYRDDMAYQEIIGDWNLDTGEDLDKQLALWKE